MTYRYNILNFFLSIYILIYNGIRHQYQFYYKSASKETLSRNERGRFGALKFDSTHHFFRNACTKSGSLQFTQFSRCWLILSVYILLDCSEFGNFVITLIRILKRFVLIRLLYNCILSISDMDKFHNYRSFIKQKIKEISKFVLNTLDRVAVSYVWMKYHMLALGL